MIFSIVSRLWDQRLLLVMGIMCACTSVPPQAVMLSEAVGERLAAIQNSHENFVHAYFALSRDRVEDFIQNRWIPEFLSNFVDQAQLMNLLENPQVLTPELQNRMKAEISGSMSLGPVDQDRIIQIVNSVMGDGERGQIVIDFAQAAMEQIELQRRALMNPIIAQENEVLRELRANYSELNQMQGTVTAHLQSINEVTELQDHMLDRLNLLRARDQLVQKAIDLNDEVVRLTESGETATVIVNKIKEKLDQTTHENEGD